MKKARKYKYSVPQLKFQLTNKKSFIDIACQVNDLNQLTLNFDKNMNLKKDFTFFLVFFLVLSVSAQTKKGTISINLSDIPVSEAIKKIEDVSSYTFFYDAAKINLNQKVSLSVKDKTIQQAIAQMLKNTNIKFEISDLQIVLYQGEKTRTTSSIINEIRGLVTDNDGVPIAGVSITIKGTKKGTASDTNGNYSINQVPDNATLVFSFMGMISKEIPVLDKKIINVSLNEKNIDINEVVVVGYGTQKKVDLTGSVSSISNEDIMRGQPSSIEQALKGKIPGVQVQNTDGAPGGGIIIKIRGASSITAGNSPLYVIDGFPAPISDDPQNNPLSKLSPESIDNISFLKDVSSTAAYGAQGANGVILITTKKAKENISSFSVRVSSGFSKLSNSLEMLNNEEYMKSMMLTGVMNQRWENSDFYEDYKNQIWKTDPSRFKSYQDLCLRVGHQNKYDVTYSGGNSVVKNMTSFSLLNNDGVVINSGYKNFNILSNTSVQLLPKLSINLNLSYNYNITDGIGYINSIATFSPLIPKEWTFKEIDDNLYYTGKLDNPYRLLTDTEQKQNKSQFLVQPEINWEIIKGLTLKGGAGIRLLGTDLKKYVPTTILSSYNNEGEAKVSNDNGINVRYMAQLNYARKINKIHDISFSLVGEANSYRYESFSQSYTHFNTDLGWYGIASAKSGTFVTPPSISYNKYNMMSAAILGNYSLKGKYLFKASLRADGSSKFGLNSRWGYFPSGAIGWRVSEEDFFKSSILSKYINNLKVRVSGGEVGNDQIDNYIYIKTLAVNSRRGIFVNATSATDNGLYASAIPTTILANYSNKMSNADIAWETTKEINYGFDLGLFNSRLNLTFDFYQKVTNNMLLNKALPMISGFDNVTRNIGSVGNKGFELGLNGNIIDGKDFSWDASINISANRSKVLDLGGVDLMLESRSVGSSSKSENVLIQVGKPLGLLYGLQMEGVRSTWASDDNAPNSTYWYNTQREAPYGFPSFADINGDGTVDKKDKTVIGCVEPAFIGGFNQRLGYKFIELSMDFSWSVGNDIINGNYYNLANLSSIDNKLKSYYKYVWFANNGGTIPGPGGGDWSGQGKGEATPSEIVEDGSFLKMNNLSLGVVLPKKLVPVKHIEMIKLTYSVSNLFTLTRYSGYDPEVASGSNIDNRILSGVDISAYPYSRTHLISLNINF
ncbi:MAG: SusC/RagA family TonB-linked outer membrane protein [Bacteroidales bacterium]|nr:SusC/RagA family TonB-linked outer membrane protein [Bacteroidales bacterium]